MGKLTITILLAFLLGCQGEKIPEDDASNSPINTKVTINADHEKEVHAFQQDLNKSYHFIDRPWVLAKPIHEFNKNKFPVPLNE